MRQQAVYVGANIVYEKNSEEESHTNTTCKHMIVASEAPGYQS